MKKLLLQTFVHLSFRTVAVDIHLCTLWQRSVFVVAHCAIKETLQQHQQQQNDKIQIKKAAATIEENPSLISPKVADGCWLMAGDVAR